MKTFTISPPEAKSPTLVLTELEVDLIKGLHEGRLNKDQQISAFNLIVAKLCRIEGHSFAGENTHTTARNEGMRLIGIYMKYIVNTPYDKL